MDPWTVVLDDDPTGTQGLSGVPVIITPSRACFDWAFGQGRVVYISTNTRALDRGSAREVIAGAVRLADECARRHASEFRIISRGDSTLRGHFPLEVEIALAGSPDDVFVGCLLVPAFPSAGRLTIAGRHVVRLADEWIPISQTEYARDATFGYAHSRLDEWARARVPERWEVTPLSSALFDQGEDAVAAALSTGVFTVVCPDIRGDDDLGILIRAQRIAEAAGFRHIVQCGPAYARLFAGLAAAPPIPGLPQPGHGIVVVGSHTSTTTAQVQSALARGGRSYVELNCAKVLGTGRREEIDRCVAAGIANLSDETVIIATSRVRVDGTDSNDSLRVAASIAAAVREITVRLLERRPAFVVAKGGITSRDVVADCLRWSAATVIGPLVDDTLPVWRSWKPAPDDPICVIFPGNVGDADLLDRALDRLDPVDRRLMHS